LDVYNWSSYYDVVKSEGVDGGEEINPLCDIDIIF